MSIIRELLEAKDYPDNFPEVLLHIEVELDTLMRGTYEELLDLSLKSEEKESKWSLKSNLLLKKNYLM